MNTYLAFGIGTFLFIFGLLGFKALIIDSAGRLKKQVTLNDINQSLTPASIFICSTGAWMAGFLPIFALGLGVSGFYVLQQNYKTVFRGIRDTRLMKTRMPLFTSISLLILIIGLSTGEVITPVSDYPLLARAEYHIDMLAAYFANRG